MPSNNNWLYIVAVCLLIAIVLSQVLPSPSSRKRKRIGNVEPRIIVLLRQFDPLIVLLSLFVCALVYHQAPSPRWAALVLIAFLLSSQLFGQLEARDSSRLGTYLHKALQWLFVVAVLLLTAYAFKVSDQLPRRVFLTWFVVTPIALCLSQAVRSRIVPPRTR